MKTIASQTLDLRRQHRLLGPGQKEIEELADETDAATTNTNRIQFGTNWSCTTPRAQLTLHHLVPKAQTSAARSEVHTAFVCTSS